MNKQTNVQIIDEDNSLLLWRESDSGVSKLILNAFGQVSYVFIGKDGTKNRNTFSQPLDFNKIYSLYYSK